MEDGDDAPRLTPAAAANATPQRSGGGPDADCDGSSCTGTSKANAPLAEPRALADPRKNKAREVNWKPYVKASVERKKRTSAGNARGTNVERERERVRERETGRVISLAIVTCQLLHACFAMWILVKSSTEQVPKHASTLCITRFQSSWAKQSLQLCLRHSSFNKPARHHEHFSFQ